MSDSGYAVPRTPHAIVMLVVTTNSGEVLYLEKEEP